MRLSENVGFREEKKISETLGSNILKVSFCCDRFYQFLLLGLKQTDSMHAVDTPLRLVATLDGASKV